MTIKQHGGIFGRNPTFNDVKAGALGIGGGRTGVVAGVEITTKFCVKDEDNGVLAGLVHANNTTAASPAVLYACRSRGTLDAPTVVEDDDSLASIIVAGNDGTDLAIAARIDFEVDGTPGSNDMPGRIVFKTTPDASQIPVSAMEINSAQNVTLSTGNLVIGTSGKGIDFSATSGTGTSELFDDYEEGTFTPVVEGVTTAGTYTYATQSGVYTKVGDLVTVTINLVDITESAAGSGSLRITGLPFSASGTHVGSLWARSVNFDASAAYLVPYSSLTSIFINEVVDNAAGGALNIADLVSGSARLYITMTYKV
jgi:hypothetical protein